VSSDLSWRSERARLAALRRYRAADDPDVLAADRGLRAIRLAEHVQRVVDAAPPLTTEQRSRIARILLAEPAASS
jgi:hypothetical protein